MKKISKFLLIIMLFMICPVVNAMEIEHFTTKAGEDITFTDNANASVLLAGMDVESTGNVKGILALAGNEVTFSGNSDYAFLAGNDIELDGTVNNDAFIAGNLITSSSDAHFKRDTVIAGNDVVLSGKFDRNVSVYASKVTIKGNVKDNLKLYASKIIVENATIGSISYPEDAVVKISDDAVIGTTNKTEPISNNDDNDYMNTISSKIWSFACYALVFAVLCLLFPKITSKINDKYEKMEFGEGVEVLTKGLVLIILMPVISVLFMLTGLGFPIGIISIILYFIAIYLSTVFTAYLLGYKIWQKAFNKDMNVLLVGLIGLFVLLILNLIPGVRYFVSIITVLVGLGLIYDSVKEAR